MLRRLHSEQPEGFAFTPGNQDWAERQIAKYPEGRQASAVIPLLWRAQEQEGWLSRPAIEHVADMLGMARIRALEVATFYFMFQLSPVGSVAHVQICGTTPCMLCGSESLMQVCIEKIAAHPHELSADGKFSWEEVECLGACANAPMVQIGKDFYEDLTPESFGGILDAFARGEVPRPGPQNGRYASEPISGLTSLQEWGGDRQPANASITLAEAMGDTVARILGDAKPATPARSTAAKPAASPQALPEATAPQAEPAKPVETAKPVEPVATPGEAPPQGLAAARDGEPDNLKEIKGIGPKLEKLLQSMGFFHFDQIANWTDAEIAWVDANLKGFRGRATRDDWMGQARKLAAGEATEFSGRVKKGNVYGGG